MINLTTTNRQLLKSLQFDGEARRDARVIAGGVLIIMMRQRLLMPKS
jgi:hypothetical protein